MKKLLIGLSSMAAYSVFASQAFASVDAGSTCPGNGFGGLCFNATQLGAVIGSLITFFFVILGILALAFLIWGGIKWLTSEGDSKQVEAARNHIINAVIGLIVIFLSYLVVNVLLAFFTGGQFSLSHIVLPTIGQH